MTLHTQSARQPKPATDPHPATEEDYDKIAHPGGTHTPKGPDIGPNDAVHAGSASPKPDYKVRTKNLR